MPLWFGRYAVVTGGPYYDCPRYMFGVKMAEEIRAPNQVSVPTRDFGVPKTSALDNGVKLTVQAVLSGQQVYVGCMGGKGRTGLFLAVLAKAFGVKNPVEYVRKHYYEHAVETKEQYAFVTHYQVPRQVLLSISLSKCLSFMRPKNITSTINHNDDWK
jgi:hypothetical protein